MLLGEDGADEADDRGTVGEDDFRLSAAVKQANEAREALLEEQMARFEKLS